MRTYTYIHIYIHIHAHTYIQSLEYVSRNENAVRSESAAKLNSRNGRGRTRAANKQYQCAFFVVVGNDADVKEELNTYAISGHMKSGHANKLNVEDAIRVSINSVCSTYGNKYRLSKNVPPCTPKAKFRRAY